MKVWKRVVEKRVGTGVSILENYFGFHAGTFNDKSHSSCEEVGGAVQGEEDEPPHSVHRSRKTYDKVPREVVWSC